jgi:alanyl-tRNA synthetase
MFKGGLQDHSEITTRYHTATHLLHSALRSILGQHVHQKGSNITAQRLRFDFSHPEKLSPDQITQVENFINRIVTSDLPVTRLEMPKADALAQGALAFFPEKYPDVTTVYKIADISFELCGGPHVTSTGQVGRIKIIKEESAGSGVRRIYAALA